MQTKKKVSVKLKSFWQVRPLQWKKIWLKEVLTMTEKTWKWLHGIPLFKVFEPIFAFLLNSLTDHFSVNFWLCSLYFLVMTSWLSLCCLKQWFLKPVSNFWGLQNLSTFQMSLFFSNSASVFSCCLSSWWEVTRINLAFAQKQALVLGLRGIRNLPIWVALETIYTPVNLP